jgi:predicted O-methyltransferase YrrM
MSKISKAFKAFGLILKKPFLLNLLIDSEDEKQDYVAQKYGLPEGLPTADISEFIDESEEILPYSFLEGSSLPTDFALLRSICRKNHAEDYLEIGTWRGESVANIAPFVKNCFSLNLPDEMMRLMGMDEDYIGMHRYFSKDIPNITHLQADSQTFIFASLNKKFDVIFLDGDHHTESIAKDTQNAFRLLKDDNSVIVWHDYGLGTETTRFNVLAGILDGCPKENIKHLYRVSHTLCAIYTRKEFKASYVKPNSKPGVSFEVGLKLKKFS